jgi:hypothetical protein
VKPIPAEVLREIAAGRLIDVNQEASDLAAYALALQEEVRELADLLECELAWESVEKYTAHARALLPAPTTEGKRCGMSGFDPSVLDAIRRAADLLPEHLTATASGSLTAPTSPSPRPAAPTPPGAAGRAD